MNLVGKVGLDGLKFRNNSWQIRLVDVKPTSQFISVADTILNDAIDGDSAAFVSDAVDFKLTFYGIEGRTTA